MLRLDSLGRVALGAFARRSPCGLARQYTRGFGFGKRLVLRYKTHMGKTIRPYRIAGYVVVSSGIAWDVDSQHLYQNTQDWVLWAEQFKSVALVELLTEKMKGDEAVLPWWTVVEQVYLYWPWWQFKASWLNFGRRRANRKAAKKAALYFSSEEVAKRRLASQ